MTLLDNAKETVEKIGREHTKPDDDWDQAIVIEDADGNITMGALFLEDTESTAMAVVALMAEGRAQNIALVQSVWTWVGNPAERALDPREIKDIPGRGEAVLVVAASADGTMEAHKAEIVRHENAPPTLGPWKVEDYTLVGGPMAHAIRMGFVLVEQAKARG